METLPIVWVRPLAAWEPHGELAGHSRNRGLHRPSGSHRGRWFIVAIAHHMVTVSSRDVSSSGYQASLPVKTYPRVEALPIKEGPPINQDHVHWHSRAR